MIKNIAIIHARGGSKRIPRKNIKNFLGKPAISYPIEAAKKSGLFSHIFVSTDDKEIASISQEYGATIPYMRPGELADDFSTTTDVLLFDIDSLSKKYDFDNVCCIYGTSVFLKPEYLKDAHDQLSNNEKIERVITMTDYPASIHRSLSINNNDFLQVDNPGKFKMRSQDLPQHYYDAALFYFLNKSTFLKDKKIFSSHTKGICIPNYNVVDIDTLDDWKRAELYYKNLITNN